MQWGRVLEYRSGEIRFDGILFFCGASLGQGVSTSPIQVVARLSMIGHRIGGNAFYARGRCGRSAGLLSNTIGAVR